MRMKRNDLLKAVASATGYNQADIDAVLKATLEVIEEEISDKETSIKIGWLTVGSKMNNPRQARNPKTGETFMTEARLAPYAKIGGSFKETFKGK